MFQKQGDLLLKAGEWPPYLFVSYDFYWTKSKIVNRATSRVLLGTKRFLKTIHEISWYLDSPDSGTAIFLFNGCNATLTKAKTLQVSIILQVNENSIFSK